MPSALHHIIGLGRAVGWVPTLDILARRALKRPGAVTKMLSGAEGPIEIDPLNSDLFVAAQIFGHREYANDDRVTANLNSRADELVKSDYVPVIIDGGANVGYSALFFAITFPSALIIALEPDPTTYSALVRNTSREPRIQPMHAALWSHENGVNLQGSSRGSWSHAVAEVGTPTPSVTLHGLFERNPSWRPLIVKLDIEGAEKTVVAASPEVLRSAACIMIEPHDFMHAGAACLTPLFKALADRPMDTLLNGENLFLIDPAITRHCAVG